MKRRGRTARSRRTGRWRRWRQRRWSRTRTYRTRRISWASCSYHSNYWCCIVVVLWMSFGGQQRRFSGGRRSPARESCLCTRTPEQRRTEPKGSLHLSACLVTPDNCTSQAWKINFIKISSYQVLKMLATGTLQQLFSYIIYNILSVVPPSLYQLVLLTRTRINGILTCYIYFETFCWITVI